MQRNFAASLAALLVAALVSIVSPAAPTFAAGDPCGPTGNKVACENSKPGTSPEIWDDVSGAGDDSIQGFATDISVNVGQRVDFKIDTDASSYTVDIYRIGYYQGNGARKITSVNPSASLPQNQPSCITDPATELFDCGNWGVSASWNVPSTAISGVYIAHLKRTNGDTSHITFIVRDDASTSQVVFQTSDTTWQAYNTYGGSSFYTGGANGRAYKLSYNRPFATRTGTTARDFFFANEYPMVRFMEKNGYDVSYMAGVDTHRRGQLIRNHKVFLSVGHDEYWSGPQRANVESARDAGVNLQFLSGNEMYWRTRFEPSADASRTANRTLVSYKETWGNDKIDPSPEWTGTWRDPRFAPASQGGGRPENALTGTAYMVNHDDLRVTVGAAEGKLRMWRNTALANLPAGASQPLAPHTVGYESNEDLDNGFRPAGLIRLSTTTGPTPEYLLDYGNTVAPGTTTHNTTMYKAPSGALVFSAGSVQWTWGLDSEHDSPYAPEPADVRMQQAQVNLLADMGAQPNTLSAPLVAATKSTDTTAPTATISTPASGASLANGTNLTVTGTASDVGGRVAGVEVSTDGGTTWHPAQGTTAWTYTSVLKGQGTVSLRVRATDDSANIGAAATRNVTVQCPCSIFGAEVPKTPATDDGSPTELGLRFSPTVAGFISGARFYKGVGNGGTHQASLWSSTGQLLARGSFVNETATGWQTVQFASAVPVAAGQTYVVSYSAPQGRYAVRGNAFYERPVLAGPLRVAGGFGAEAAGVYANLGQFPSSSFGSSNYYVDALFTTTDQSPLSATGQTPLADSSSVPVTTTVSATYSKPLAAGTAGITVKDALNNTVAGTTAYNATTRTITFTPNAPLNGFVRYTATLSGTDTIGQQITGGKTWSFTTAKPAGPPGVCPCSLFDDSTVPTVLEDSDQAAVSLGVRFSPSVNGTVTGVRFYKGPNNTGTHTGALWRADGTQLATGTFTGESSAGWQTLTFAQPVAVTANTEYVASYRTTVGRYSVTPNGFGSANLSKPPLQVAGDSGSYTYGTGFPSSSSPSNYMVDVLFSKSASPLTVVAQEPAPGAVEVSRGSKVKVTFSTAVNAGSTMTLKQGATTIPGSAQLSSDGTALTFTPTSALPGAADLTVSLSGVTSTEGVALPTQTWTFRTRSAADPATQSLFGAQVPAVPSADESSPVELGAAFVPSKNGRVTGIRFFKGTGNNGVHKGSLWSSTGTKLAGVTFVGETASGWQTATLSSPVDVTAGTTYVVSYLAPQGHYSYTPGFFNEPLVSGDLTAPAGNNGRYLYGAAGGFPTNSWGSTNYFVDIVFEKGPGTIAVSGRTPADGAVGELASVKPSITLSEPIKPAGWSMTVSQGGTPVAGTVALSGNSRTLTFTPSAPLAVGTQFTVTVSGVVSQEDAVLPTQTWSFRTENAASVLTSMFTGLTPATASVDDSGPVELGTAFTPSVSGSATAISFYKGAGNTGTHTGSIWSQAGTRLATVTFADETASGWQTATLSTPLALTAGQAYVVSYYAPNGHYSATPAFFADGWTAGPLSAPAAGNGRFVYAGGGGFPASSWNATNYFVDLVFRQNSP